MKNRFILCGIIISCLGFSTITAAKKTALMVFAAKKQAHSISKGRHTIHMQTFDVTLSNESNKYVDLSKYCLIAVAKNGKKFNMDAVDQELIRGEISPHKSVKGLATFSSKDESVYAASAVQIKKGKCK